MADPYDPTSFRDQPRLPSNSADRPTGFDDDDDDFEIAMRRTPFPPMMLAAGILWIVCGAMIALLLLISLLLGDLSHVVWTGIASVFFIKDGVQLLRGTFRDPKIDGLICIALAGWIALQGYLRFEQSRSLFELAFTVFYTGLILLPGVLVLIGRQQYLGWQAENAKI